MEIVEIALVNKCCSCVLGCGVVLRGLDVRFHVRFECVHRIVTCRFDYCIGIEHSALTTAKNNAKFTLWCVLFVCMCVYMCLYVYLCVCMCLCNAQVTILDFFCTSISIFWNEFFDYVCMYVFQCSSYFSFDPTGKAREEQRLCCGGEQGVGVCQGKRLPTNQYTFICIRTYIHTCR